MNFVQSGSSGAFLELFSRIEFIFRPLCTMEKVPTRSTAKAPKSAAGVETSTRFLNQFRTLTKAPLGAVLYQPEGASVFLRTTMYRQFVENQPTVKIGNYTHTLTATDHRFGMSFWDVHHPVWGTCGVLINCGDVHAENCISYGDDGGEWAFKQWIRSTDHKDIAAKLRTIARMQNQPPQPLALNDDGVS